MIFSRMESKTLSTIVRNVEVKGASLPSLLCRAANWHQTLQNRDILISCQPQRNKTMHPDNWPVHS